MDDYRPENDHIFYSPCPAPNRADLCYLAVRRIASEAKVSCAVVEVRADLDDTGMAIVSDAPKAKSSFLPRQQSPLWPTRYRPGAGLPLLHIVAGNQTHLSRVTHVPRVPRIPGKPLAVPCLPRLIIAPHTLYWRLVWHSRASSRRARLRVRHDLIEALSLVVPVRFDKCAHFTHAGTGVVAVECEGVSRLSSFQLRGYMRTELQGIVVVGLSLVQSRRTAWK